jgi:hypothetical protein
MGDLTVPRRTGPAGPESSPPSSQAQVSAGGRQKRGGRMQAGQVVLVLGYLSEPPKELFAKVRE